MPRLVRSVPRYRKHRATGQAIVTLSGQDFYLGPYGTRASKLEYDRLVAEWLARGRGPLIELAADEITIVELIAAYVVHAKTYYRKDGKPTSEIASIASAARVLKQLYGQESSNAFDPLKMLAIQQTMIRLGWSRRNINKQCQRIVRLFSWAVAQKLVRADVVAAIREVPGLRQGRTQARETELIMPVSDEVVQATLPYLQPMIRDMVQLQRLTGCRPEELCSVRPCDVDTSGSVWAYRPAVHKTQHHGRDRVVFIGPVGQCILRPYLLRDKATYCFSPAEGEKWRREAAHEHRKTPLRYGNLPGKNRCLSPRKRAGSRYSVAAYRRAIQRACEIAFGMSELIRRAPNGETKEQKADRLRLATEWRVKHCWAPNQLRHSAATEIRKRFGLEATQVVLGHSAADVTQVYAERDLEKAAAVIAQVG